MFTVYPKAISLLCVLFFGIAAGNLSAAQPTFPLYPHPDRFVINEGDDAKTCLDLDREIAMLERRTYSYKPPFYEDPFHGGSIWIGTLYSPAAYGYLAYSGAAEYTEHARILEARRRIAVLRQIKAYRRCYED
ncbi:MAG: hypothetical protein DIZ77_12320 [endosymbiont of Seepiophila jonesi]|uniref:Uncharacterized protein n=1 Tax=endosymbiont of Lamellibrachia luymesi TaxID=2200907 RepID=A0A370DVR0_9GAMM|nr:MAG: hypothetical protein DIZ79_11100 [endosymbiont of Lamellibrachia luymesi]RDH90824.1 MAG: hypothetical protein DIZ77_12320 [endosymbiont of Seepiophila jonesi]